MESGSNSTALQYDPNYWAEVILQYFKILNRQYKWI